MTKTLLLVRHGEAEGGAPGVLLGRTDAGLSRAGRAQAALLGEVLPLIGSVKIVSSPLARARETAAIAVAAAAKAAAAKAGDTVRTEATDPAGSAGAAGIPAAAADPVAAGSGLAVNTDLDLREIDFGEWEGLRFEEVERRYPSLVAAWGDFSLDFGFPGGEKLADFATRIEGVARRLATAESDTAIAFTHGGVIRALICHFLGLPLRDYLLFDITPASVTTLRLWGERGVLAGLRPGEGLSGKPFSWVWPRSSS